MGVRSRWCSVTEFQIHDRLLGCGEVLLEVGMIRDPAQTPQHKLVVQNVQRS